ncbi:Putative glycerol kinase 5 [Eumeta japonica]|uniref:Glycerol kinase 5 n=1 Tax=Eumeta variegata TaxID=151549 RepID=A0A4C1SEQ9_EUMVA|nr:Putative glycerol kinase 5 [Eumeta japonica]
MMNGQVTLRLLYEMQNNLRLKEALKAKLARFELLDSWILYKLRSGNDKDAQLEHIADITSCTATDFGPEWKNCNIPITSSVSDQAAALFGSQCFTKGDVKVTIGTGAFLDLITGERCYASLKGMYPLVAWQFDEPIFCVEGAAHDMGTVIDWGQNCGLFAEPSVSSRIAESVTDTNGVFFVPAFSGIGPINDHKAASGFIGITPSTKREHLIRALLESIVFRLVQLSETAEKETGQKLKILKLDGGVSRNNFVCQFLADASGIHVERASNPESSVMGATYAAGINMGLWKTFNDVIKFRDVECVFEPNRENFLVIRERMNTWLKAINRFGVWYS